MKGDLAGSICRAPEGSVPVRVVTYCRISAGKTGAAILVELESAFCAPEYEYGFVVFDVALRTAVPPLADVNGLSVSRSIYSRM